jgi:hypothetical protein
MAFAAPLKINGILLRTDCKHGRIWIAHCFSEQQGRICFAAAPRKQTPLSPFCLIEATLAPQSNEFAMAKEIEILDTFSELHIHPECSKGALFLRAIVEKCLPMQAPSHDAWQLFVSLLELLPLFRDWKAAPLMFALTFFEQEGVLPHSIAELPALTSEGKEVARLLLEQDEAGWRTIQIPDDLFTAVMETIGIYPNHPEKRNLR